LLLLAGSRSFNAIKQIDMSLTVDYWEWEKDELSEAIA